MKNRWLGILVTLVTSAVATSASAVPILITFDNDPVFTNQPNGFSSSDSSEVRFSDSVGNELIIVNDPVASGGSNALATLFDDDDSLLLIEFDFMATIISMDVGNDAAAFSQAGDAAVLTTFLQGVQVGQVSLELNRDGLMNQTILFDGGGDLFDGATLKYDVDPGLGLTEVVDNVQIERTDPIPEPGAAVLYGVGMLLVGRACARHPRGRRTRSRRARVA